jgi:hypothetical protein
VGSAMREAERHASRSLLFFGICTSFCNFQTLPGLFEKTRDKEKTHFDATSTITKYYHCS